MIESPFARHISEEISKKPIDIWQLTVKASPKTLQNAAELIIASPPVMRELMHKLYELPPPGQRHLYVPLFEFSTELRPQVKLIPLIKKDLWDKLQQRNQND